MGRQINFFMLQKEFNELRIAIKEKGAFLVNKHGEVLDDVYLDHVIDDVFTKRIVTSATLYLVKEQSKLLYLDTKEYGKQIRIDESDAIELWIRLPDINLNVFPISRLYYILGYYDNEGEWIVKDEQYNKLYNQMKYYIRKSYIYSPELLDYMGPYCYEEYLKGTDDCPYQGFEEEWHMLFRKKNRR